MAKSEQPTHLFNNNFEKTLYTIIKWCAIIALLTPLIVTKDLFGGSSFPYLFPKTLFYQSFVEIMFAFWITLALVNKSFRPNWRHPIVASVTLFIVVLSFTQIFSQDTHISFWAIQNSMNGLFQYWHHFMWFIVLSSTFKTWGEWRNFFITSAIVVTIVNFFGFFERITNKGQRISSTLGNPLYLSSYLLIQFFIILIFRAKETNKTIRNLLLIVSLFSLLVIIFAASRGTFLAVLPTILVATLLINKKASAYIKQTYQQKKIFFITTLVIIILFCGASLFWLSTPNGNTWTQNNLPKTIQQLTRFSFKDRTTLWNITIEGSKAHPLVGWGLQNFSIPFDKLFNVNIYKNLREPWYNESHNAYLETLVTSGFLGLATYIFLWISLFYSIKKTNTSESNNYNRKISILLYSLLIAQLIQDIFFHHTFIQNYLLFFVFAFTVFFTNSTFAKTETNKIIKENSNYKFVLIPLFIFLMWSIIVLNIRPYKQDTNNFKAVKSLMILKLTDAKTLFEKSITKKTNYETDFRINFVDKVIVLDMIYGLDSPKIKELINLSAKEMQTEVNERPNRTKTALAAAWLTVVNAGYEQDDIKTAEQLSEHALSLAPNRQEMFELQSSMAILQNDFDSAFSWLEKADSASHTTLSKGRVSFEKSALMARKGEYEQAMDYLDSANKRGYAILSQTTLVNSLAKGIKINKNLPVDLQIYVAQMVNKHSKNDHLLESATIIFHHVNKNNERDLVLNELIKINPERAKKVKKELNIK